MLVLGLKGDVITVSELTPTQVTTGERDVVGITPRPPCSRMSEALRSKAAE